MSFRAQPISFVNTGMAITIAAVSVGGYFAARPGCLQSYDVIGACAEQPYVPMHEMHGEPTEFYATSTGPGFAFIDLNHTLMATT